MTNEEKYTEAFMQAFDIDAETARGLEFQAIPAWDSVGHMTCCRSGRNLRHHART